MDLILLSRIQFAVTVMFHYIFPPLSIGLGLILVLMEGMYLRTGNPLYLQMVKYWLRIFGLTFVLGVASGIVMEFEFGTNWATYSRFVGDVFGSPLAAEGIFAFFIESTFLAILLFGWNKVGPKTHFFSTLMVCLGAHFSAVWIVVAGSWMQTPAGYEIVSTGLRTRAVITDFWAMVFNPSSMVRLSHTLIGAWQAGAFLVISVSAYYLLKKRHTEFAKSSMTIGLFVGIISSVLSLGTGHLSAMKVSQYQPAKLAAMEGHYNENGPGDMHIFGWVDNTNERVVGSIVLPGLLSFLVSGDPAKPLPGLKAFAPEDRPPVQAVFQSFHLMVVIGLGLIALSSLATLLWCRGKLYENRFILQLLLPSFIAPQLANQAGWLTTEIGRQPWIVYGLLRTKDAVSISVPASHVLLSLILFSVIYFGLFILFVYVLMKMIKQGPLAEDLVFRSDAQSE